MEVRTPHEIEQEIGLTEGNIFQGELTLDQLFFNRPFPGYGQYRMPVKNLYMCGSSTTPVAASQPPAAPTRRAKYSWTCGARIPCPKMISTTNRP